ncbi:MAG: hypothetical protein CVV00_13275 [Firmicutes bacterium HGW-Firmicutes-5]|nr:MAG: hypothetical protein CVV00_13275 [Firmicutes bacterium HGW-Firmicutes-5]
MRLEMDNNHVQKKSINQMYENWVVSKKTNQILFAAIIVLTFFYMVFLNIKNFLLYNLGWSGCGRNIDPAFYVFGKRCF